MTLEEEFNIFCNKFLENNIFSYEDGAYFNALGDMDIDELDWENTENLRDSFISFIELNFVNDNACPNSFARADFDNERILIYKLERIFPDEK